MRKVIQMGCGPLEIPCPTCRTPFRATSSFDPRDIEEASCIPLGCHGTMLCSSKINQVHEIQVASLAKLTPRWFQDDVPVVASQQQQEENVVEETEDAHQMSLACRRLSCYVPAFFFVTLFFFFAAILTATAVSTGSIVVVTWALYAMQWVLFFRIRAQHRRVRTSTWSSVKNKEWCTAVLVHTVTLAVFALSLAIPARFPRANASDMSSLETARYYGTVFGATNLSLWLLFGCIYLREHRVRVDPEKRGVARLLTACIIHTPRTGHCAGWLIYTYIRQTVMDLPLQVVVAAAAVDN